MGSRPETKRLDLEYINGLFLKVLGGVVVESRRGEDGAYWYRLGISPSPDLKKRMASFAKDFGNGVSVTFPAAFKIRVGGRAPRGTPPGSPRGSRLH